MAVFTSCRVTHYQGKGDRHPLGAVRLASPSRSCETAAIGRAGPGSLVAHFV